MAEPIRVAYMRGDAPAHLQWRDGDQQECWPRRTRLADHIRLQHVSIPSLEMGRRNFVRAHASVDGIAGRLSHDYSGGVALGARRPAMGPQSQCYRSLRSYVEGSPL